MLNATLECWMAGHHAFSFEVFEKKKWKKNYPILYFLKVKYYTKEKEKAIKINHPTVYNLNTNNYLKYL